MREDYLEQIDKMFPNGYVILYPDSEGQLRMTLANPHKDKLIEGWRQTIMGVNEIVGSQP